MTIESLRAKESDHSLAFGGGRAIGMGGLGVTLVLGNPLVTDLFPQYLACLLVDAEQFPNMHAIFLDRCDFMINTDLETVLLLVAYRTREENTITPNRRTGMPQPGNGCLPFQVFAFGNVPSGRGLESLRDARGARPTELWPVDRLAILAQSEMKDE